MKKNNTNTYYIVAGEASGDLHGAHLINSILNLNPNSVFFGLGGEKMIRSGLKSPLTTIDKLAVMGFAEVIKHLFFFISLQKKILNQISETKPEKIILIDYPGFNLRLAKKIKKVFNIKIIYYISPQLWAWKEGRIKYVDKYVDKMIVFFPFEKKWYYKRGIKVEFFGHPLVDLYKSTPKKKVLNKNFVVSFFPGSRKQEFFKHMPLYLKIIKLLHQKIDSISFILKLAPDITQKDLSSFSLPQNCFVSSGDSFGVFNQSDFSVVASGTATLEGAISNTPMAVVYKINFVSWLLIKFFVKIKYASIINILCNKEVVKEFIQGDATSQTIANYIFENKNKKPVDFSSVVSSLYKKDVYKKTAKFIVGF